MSVASLPMYDLSELRDAHAALWTGIARQLPPAGIADVPVGLTRDRPAGEVWSDPELLFSQCCGADLTGGHASRLRVVATPRYRASGCAEASYASLIVVAQGSDIREIECLRGRVAAINHPESHSGMNALRAVIAPFSRGGRFFAAVKVSGAHAASLALVASGAADVAAIDCVTHALLARHRPQALAGTRVLCRTASAPAPPYVTRADAGDDLVRRLQSALREALADREIEAACAELLLGGIEVLPAKAYLRIPAFARLAARHGYPVLR